MTELTDAERETCPTACVEFNHPGREHDEWIGSIRILGALAGYKAAEEDRAAHDAAIRAEALTPVRVVVERMKARDVDHRHDDETGHLGVQGRAYFYAGDIYDDYADLTAALRAAQPTEVQS